ncbi:aryl-alcohol dehydrogenase-like predicted oxidoreductase [Catenulispora sp. MAP12-49]
MRCFTPATAPDLALSRLGYGAMQLPGPGVWGPPGDRENLAAADLVLAAEDVAVLNEINALSD